MKRFLATALVCAAILSGCADPSTLYDITDVNIDKVEGMSLESGSFEATVILAVDYVNKSSKKVTLENISGFVRSSSGKQLARIKSPENYVVEVPKKSEGTVKIPLEFSFNNPLAIMASVMQGNFNMLKNTTLDVELDLKAGAFSKHVKETGIAVDNIVKQFEIAPQNE